MSRVPQEATAFAHRQRQLMFMVLREFERPDEAESVAAWVGGMADVLRPIEHGVYSNFLGDEGEARVHEAYPAETYERLAAIKRRFDPTNLFRLNQNIKPR
jgi:Berberine and berberine like